MVPFNGENQNPNQKVGHDFIFYQIIGGPRTQGLHGKGFLLLGGEHHDGDAGVLGENLVDGVQSAAVGQVQIQKNDIKATLFPSGKDCLLMI